MKRTMERGAEGSYRWALTLFPTHAYASEAGMGLPTTRTSTTAPAWRPTTTRSAPGAASEETGRLAGWIQGREEVHVTGPGRTSTRASRTGPSSPPTASTTCPTASSSPAPSRIPPRARSPSTCRRAYAGREVAGVRFRFEGGKVVDASAEKGEEFLIEMLDTDEGARRLGELGIGTNYGITDGTGEILLDEKIGGTVHLAVGPQLPRDRRRQRVGDPLGHDLRPPPGRQDRGRRRAAPARRQLRRLAAATLAIAAGFSGWKRVGARREKSPP